MSRGDGGARVSSAVSSLDAGSSKIELWAGLREGCEPSLQELANAIDHTCTPVLVAVGLRGAQADELKHEVFLSVCRCARNPKFAEPREITGFLKWRTRGVLSKMRAIEGRWATAREVSEDYHQPREDTSERLIAHEEESALRRALQDCLKRLSPKQELAWRLRYEGGLGSVRIAELLRISANAASLRVFAANAKIRGCLKHKGYDP